MHLAVKARVVAVLITEEVWREKGVVDAGIKELALIEIAALIYRFTFGLLESAGAIHAAQEARLGYANRSAAMRSASTGVAMLFVRAWDRARRLEDGLAGRGYEDSLRTLEPGRVRSASFLAASIALLVGIAGAALAWELLR